MNLNPTSNWRQFVMGALLSLAVLLAGCQTPPTAALSVPEGARAGDLIGLAACDYHPVEDPQAAYTAECGTLVVPENWDVADSRLIALPVVRVPAAGAAPREPIFYLQGGPGQSNLSWPPPTWLLENHAVVFVGYRGVDGSVMLDCPEVSGLLKDHAGRDMLSEPARAAYAVAAGRCAAAHREAGVDLTGYTIPGVIADMEAARVALGYDRINLLSESYGTRVAQLYAYLHPDSLRRLVLVGVNTPGRFVWDPAELDEMLTHISALCAQDAACRGRTDDLAQTISDVNHNMPRRWLFFNIDPDTVRLGTHFMFLNQSNMSAVFDAYLAAAEGDPSGLAMANLMTSLAPIDQQVFGDLAGKAASVDLERYGGIETVGLGESIMGAPMAEWIWPIAQEWPVGLIPAELRAFQESEAEMLLVNGTVDFSTPPSALDEARPFYRRAQTVLLPEFSHIGDVMGTLQPEAFAQLITSYYATGVADSSLYVYEPLSFEPGLSLALMAKLLVAAMILLPALLLLGIVWAARRRRRPSASAVAVWQVNQQTTD